MSTERKSLSTTANKQDVNKASKEILKNHILEDDAPKIGDANVDNEKMEDIPEKPVLKDEKEDKLDSAKTSEEILKNHIPEDDLAKLGDANVDNENIENISENFLSKDGEDKSTDSDPSTKFDNILQDSQHSGESILIKNDEVQVLKSETTETGNEVLKSDTTETGEEVLKGDTTETGKEVLKSDTAETETLKSETTETEVLNIEATGTETELITSENIETETELITGETTETETKVLKNTTRGTETEQITSDSTENETQVLKNETTWLTELITSDTTETEVLKSETTAGMETEVLKSETTAGMETEVLKSETTGIETEDETTNIKIAASGFADSDEDVSPDSEDEDSLKQPFIGFSEIQKSKLFSIVDRQAMMMFEIIQSLQDQLMEENFASLLAHKDSLVVPQSVLVLPGGGDINLRVFKDDPPKKIHPSSSSDAIKELKEGSEGHKSPKRIRPLLLPFLEGWKRKILSESDSSSGRNAGDVYYVSPNNVKCWSIGQVAQYLKQYPSLELTVKNFSFAKLPLQGFKGARTPFGGKPFSEKVGMSDDMDDDFDKEKYGFAFQGSSSRRVIQPPKRYATGHTVVYPEKKTKMSPKISKRNTDDSMMEMGMLPPKYPKAKIVHVSPATDSQLVRRRGRPPIPGGKKDLLVQAKAIAAAKETVDNISEFDDSNSMFQISAFRQYHSLMETSMEQYQESTQEEMEVDSDSEEYKDSCFPLVEENSLRGCSENSEHLLLCSIRCSGMTGEIPTLQCKRCLCFYHPECLGLPPNLSYNSFLCSNCEGESAELRMIPSTPPFKAKPKQAEAKKSSLEPRKTGATIKPLPPLIRANFPKMPDFMNNMRYRLPPPQDPRPPVLQPAMSFGKSGIRMMPKLTPPPPLPLSRPMSSDIAMSISPISMKRGRGRPSINSKLIPQLSKHLTITPFTIPKKNPVPTVPYLHPVPPLRIFSKTTSNAKPTWLYNNPNKGTLSKILANMKSSAAVKIKQSQMNKIDKPSGTTLQIIKQQKERNKQKCKTQVDNSNSPHVFQRDTQGLVIVGHNKFLALPTTAVKGFKSPTNPEKSVKSPTNPEKRVKSPTTAVKGFKSPTNPEKRVKSSANTEKSVKPPTNPEKRVTSPTNPEKRVKSPTNAEKSVKSPTNSEKSVKSPTNAEISVTSPTNAEKSFKSPKIAGKGFKSPINPEKRVKSPANSEKSVKSPTNAEKSLESSKNAEKSLDSPTECFGVTKP